MSEEQSKQPKPSKRGDEQTSEKGSLNSEEAKKSQTDAKGDDKSKKSSVYDDDSKSISMTGVLKVIKQEGDKDQADLAKNIEDMRKAAKEKGIATTEIDKFAKETFSAETQDKQSGDDSEGTD